MNPVLIGNYISEKRKSLGWTQRQLARQLSVTHQAVSRWEQGLALPDIETLVAMARLFGITVDRLLNPELKAATSASEPVYEDIEDEPEELEDTEETDELEEPEQPVQAEQIKQSQEQNKNVESEKSDMSGEQDEPEERERYRQHRTYKGPNIRIPNIKIPNIQIPNIKIPNIKMPNIQFSNIPMYGKHGISSRPDCPEGFDGQSGFDASDESKQYKDPQKQGHQNQTDTKSFRPDGEIDEILCKLEDMAPFVSRDIFSKKVMSIIEQAESINADTLCDLAPFLSKEALYAALDKIDVDDFDTDFIEDIAPFIRGPKLAELISNIKDKQWLIDNFEDLVPFLPREYADRIFMELF